MQSYMYTPYMIYSLSVWVDLNESRLTQCESSLVVSRSEFLNNVIPVLMGTMGPGFRGLLLR